MKNAGIAAIKLRSQAEAVLACRPAANDGTGELDLVRALHELQVHQVELEMQNEELQQANMNLVRLRDEYRDLFDYSPVAQFKLPPPGNAMLMNMALLILLDLPPDSQVNALDPYIAEEDRKVWSDCQTGLRLKGHRDGCRLKLRTKTGVTRYVEVFLTNFVTMHSGAILGAVVPISEEAYPGG